MGRPLCGGIKIKEKESSRLLELIQLREKYLDFVNSIDSSKLMVYLDKNCYPFLKSSEFQILDGKIKEIIKEHFIGSLHNKEKEIKDLVNEL